MGEHVRLRLSVSMVTPDPRRVVWEEAGLVLSWDPELLQEREIHIQIKFILLNQIIEYRDNLE